MITNTGIATIATVVMTLNKDNSHNFQRHDLPVLPVLPLLFDVVFIATSDHKTSAQIFKPQRNDEHEENQKRSVPNEPSSPSFLRCLCLSLPFRFNSSPCGVPRNSCRTSLDKS